MFFFFKKAYSLYAILLCATNESDVAAEYLQTGSTKCPGSNILAILSDKLKINKYLSLSDITIEQFPMTTDDELETVNYNDILNKNQYEWDYNVQFNDQNVKSMMERCITMIKNLDGIPIIYFVLRVLWNIIQYPTNNKIRQIDINQIRIRTNPYHDVAIGILQDCGFKIIYNNNKEFLFLRPAKQSNDIKAITYYGDIIVGSFFLFIYCHFFGIISNIIYTQNRALFNIPLLDLVQGLVKFGIDDIFSDFQHLCFQRKGCHLRCSIQFFFPQG